jgi:hypothetical protein
MASPSNWLFRTQHLMTARLLMRKQAIVNKTVNGGKHLSHSSQMPGAVSKRAIGKISGLHHLLIWRGCGYEPANFKHSQRHGSLITGVLAREQP